MTRSLIIAALLLAAGAAHAQSRPPGVLDPKKPIYVTSHIDVTSEFSKRTAEAIRVYMEAARREPGAVRIEAVQEARDNHFDVLEVWRDRAAYDAHTASAATIHFHDVIFPWRGSPFEERLANPIAP
jgi:quinol monooxygenase YgiN